MHSGLICLQELGILVSMLSYCVSSLHLVVSLPVSPLQLLSLFAIFTSLSIGPHPSLFVCNCPSVHLSCHCSTRISFTLSSSLVSLIPFLPSLCPSIASLCLRGRCRTFVPYMQKPRAQSILVPTAGSGTHAAPSSSRGL